MPRVIEDVRAPLGVITEARIFVLVACGAVEATQRPVVFREVRRHPIEEHADARLMQRVDKEPEIIRRAEA